MNKKVCVLGLGYIGLPTAAVLADHGFQVHGVDVNEEAIGLINQGKTHIFEPDLDRKVKSAVDSGLLSASVAPDYSDVFIIAVPTPFKENHKPNLGYIEAATKSIAPYIKPGNLIILESTSPVGTTEMIKEWILEERRDLNTITNNINRIFISHCPERVLPGKILEEIISNDRIVGGVDEESTEITAVFYSTFVNGEILKTNARTAEMSKLTENSFRDVNIAFANELSMICDEIGIDVWELIQLANHHPRVNILQPGPGVGGHCIAVDPWFIVDKSPKTSQLIHTARKVNDLKPHYVVEKIKEAIMSIDNPTIACLGLSFKANIDDLRESPAIEIVKELSAYYKKIYVAEPHINELPAFMMDNNIQLINTEDAINKADLVVLLVDHDYFKAIDTEVLSNKLVIDTRGVLSVDKEKAFTTIL